MNKSAELDFNEEELKNDHQLYPIYLQYYNGLVKASQVTPPDFTVSPPTITLPSGEVVIDTDTIAKELGNYSTILLKNSAYLMANTMQAAVDSGGSGGSGIWGDYVKKAGDSMNGLLSALYGFEAGMEGRRAFKVSKDAIDMTGTVKVTNGTVKVTNGAVKLYTSTLHFGDSVNISYSQDTLTLNGNLNVAPNNTVSVGTTKITNDTVLVNEHPVFHTGNANIPSVTWTMNDAEIHNNANVHGNTNLTGMLSANGGMRLSHDGNLLLESHIDNETHSASILYYDDLNLIAGKSLRIAGKSIISKELPKDGAVVVSAPETSLKLGSDTTQKIVLNTALYDYSGLTQLVKPDGSGNFPNAFSAGCGNALPSVMRTYYISKDNYGVEFSKNIRIGKDGVRVCYKDNALTYIYPHDSSITNDIEYKMWQENIESQFYPSTQQIRGIAFDNNVDLFAFNKPIFVSDIQIKSPGKQYKTRITENVFYFNDNVFLEGVRDGIRHAGNSYFDGTLSTSRFSPGMLGYGWGIIQNEALGGVEAHFDGLTVRKKMKVFELEVQKQSVVNGSWMVSNSCSGDFVEEIL